MVRAKFRCLSTKFTHKGEAYAELKPVIAKNADWTGGSEENAAFWSASPSGECMLCFRADAFPFEAGAYYYIDLEALDDDIPRAPDSHEVWTLHEVADRGETLGVWFDLPWLNRGAAQAMINGTLKIDIHNKAAHAPFRGHAGTRWVVRFTRADVGNTGCPYTS